MEPEPTPDLAEPPNYDPQRRVDNALPVTQLGERAICEIKRHPIGIFGVYLAAGGLLIIAAVIAFLLAPHFITNSSGSGKTTALVGALVFAVVATVSLAFTYISTKVYWGNSWILTSDSITQIEQDSLFKRHSSQLSLGSLEDVTAEQNGVLTHLFNYGVIRVETAGQSSKFVFVNCPNPNYYAQQILAARENFELGRREPAANSQGLQAGDPGYGAYQPPASPTIQANPDDANA